MTFSFTAALTDDISRIRQLINDTVDLGHKFEDETLTYYLSVGGTVFEAGSLALEQLARRYALVPDVQVGNKRMSGSKISDALMARATELRSQAPTYAGSPAPYTAGISVAEFLANYEDEDIPRPVLGIVGSEFPPLPQELD